MIGNGLFQAQLETIGSILKILGIFEERQLYPKKGVGASYFRGMGYREVYEECLKEYIYDFRLTDQSLLLFEKEGKTVHDGCLRFCYYESPVAVLPYTDFVAEKLGLTPEQENYDQEITEWGDELRSEYELYIGSSNNKNAITPLRYDYQPSDYRPGIHPASHVHFGFENTIRVGTTRVMNPIGFTLLILRQRYPDAWTKLLGKTEASSWCKNVRSEVDEIETCYYKQHDEWELNLH